MNYSKDANVRVTLSKYENSEICHSEMNLSFLKRLLSRSLRHTYDLTVRTVICFSIRNTS